MRMARICFIALAGIVGAALGLPHKLRSVGTGSRTNGVVPLAVESVAVELQLLHGPLRYRNTCLIGAAIELRSDA